MSRGVRRAGWRGWTTGRTGLGRVRIKCRPMSRLRLLSCAWRIRRGAASSGVRTREARREAGGVGVVGLPGAGPAEPDRPSGQAAAGSQVEAVERGRPMEQWQMDAIGRFVLTDETRAKALTGVDDHSRFWVGAHLMVRESSRGLGDGRASALRAHNPSVLGVASAHHVARSACRSKAIEILVGCTRRMSPIRPTDGGLPEGNHRHMRIS